MSYNEMSNEEPAWAGPLYIAFITLSGPFMWLIALCLWLDEKYHHNPPTGGVRI